MVSGFNGRRGNGNIVHHSWVFGEILRQFVTVRVLSEASLHVSGTFDVFDRHWSTELICKLFCPSLSVTFGTILNFDGDFDAHDDGVLIT